MKKKSRSEGPFEGWHLSYQGHERFVRIGNFDAALAEFCSLVGVSEDVVRSDQGWRNLGSRPQYIPGYTREDQVAEAEAAEVAEGVEGPVGSVGMEGVSGDLSGLEDNEPEQAE